MRDQTSFLEHDERNVEIESSSSIPLSLSTLAREFSASRETVRTWIDAVGAQPCGSKNGYPLFALRDCIRGFRLKTPPDDLPPAQRLAHYKAVQAADEVALQRGKHVTAEAHKLEVARILKICAQEFDSMTDELERDMSVDPAVLSAIEEKLDRARQRMYEGITASVDELDAATQGD